MSLLIELYRRLPPRLREGLKRSLHGSGHGESWTDDFKARHTAVGKKRVDLAAEDLARRYGEAFPEVAGRACMDLGSGYVPSEALVLHLLGAARVVATDYNRIARFNHLWRALKASDLTRLRAACRTLKADAGFDARLDRLAAMTDAQGEAYLNDHIVYIAPHDFAAAPIGETFAYIHSLSVLEHIPPAILGPLLANVRACLAPGGAMGHVIDLCDHRDLEGAPLQFLAVGDDYDPARDVDARGNRLRKSDWLALFAALPNLETVCLWEEAVAPEKIPAHRQAQFADLSPADLSAGRILAVSRALQTG